METVQTADRMTQLPAGAPPQAALALGRYSLVSRLGAGAFGVVWLAIDEHLGREVAVKRIELRDEQIGARAQREALAAARLSHPAIVALYEASREGDAFFLVSELVRGRPLADLLDANALSDRDILRIGVALTEGLEHAHEHGIVHRDVKPANVLVPERALSEAGLAKLTDFGVAAMTGDDGITRTGDVVGTLAYMAPEQAEARQVTGSADLYSLALVLYEALSGVNPVRAQGAGATARRVGMRLPSLLRSRPDLPPGACLALDRALLADAGQRGTLAELRAELTAAISGAGSDVGPIEAAELWDPRQGHSPPRRMRRRERERQLRLLDDGERSGRWSAAVATGVVTAVATTLLPASAGISPGAAGVFGCIAAVAAVLLPRVVWLAVCAALIVLLAASGLPGAAVLVLAAVAPIPFLLAQRGSLWPAPAGAVVVGALSAGLAWPALAAQAATPLRRAALGALGAWWLLLADQLLARPVLLGAVSSDAWKGSAADAASDVIWPLLTSGALLLALPWALGAALLPLLVRGRRLALDFVFVSAWSVALAASSAAVAAGLAWPHGAVTVQGLAAGTLLGALIALAAAAARPSPGGPDLP